METNQQPLQERLSKFDEERLEAHATIVRFYDETKRINRQLSPGQQKHLELVCKALVRFGDPGRDWRELADKILNP
jgi:ABC-type uncharacterized transport system ATPase subunit